MSTTPKPYREERAIVLVGNFNPSIFQPAWFASEGLIRPSEAETAKIELIHPDVAQVDFGGYNLLVTQNRFQLRTEQAPYFPVIFDLAHGIFQLLHHTPLQAAGHNAAQDYQLRDELQWHEFGHRLAPKENIWAPLMANPGLRSVSVESRRTDDRGFQRVDVIPLATPKPHSVRFSVLNHFDAISPSTSTRELFDFVVRQRENTEEFVKKVFSHLITAAQGAL